MSQCQSKCGDGYLAADEACETFKFDSKGNLTPIPGCSSDCKSPLPNYQCSTVQSGTLSANTVYSNYIQRMIQLGTIQDYNLLPMPSCPFTLQTSVCKYGFCGDGITSGTEQCDNKNQLGCSTGCKPDLGYKCLFTLAGETVCSTTCGDVIKAGAETCDNGNQPGCSVLCQVDKGYTCPSTDVNGKSLCNPICGDKLRVFGEGCDNGKLAGCKNCIVEQGYTCSENTQGQSTCTTKCGDAIKADVEPCDNGNQVGCSRNCSPDTGYQCLTTDSNGKSICTPICGDGILTGNEQCDDGNLNKGDGCGTDCKVEAGFRCTQPLLFIGPSVCYRSLW